MNTVRERCWGGSPKISIFPHLFFSRKNEEKKKENRRRKKRDAWGHLVLLRNRVRSWGRWAVSVQLIHFHGICFSLWSPCLAILTVNSHIRVFLFSATTPFCCVLCVPSYLWPNQHLLFQKVGGITSYAKEHLLSLGSWLLSSPMASCRFFSMFLSPLFFSIYM